MIGDDMQHYATLDVGLALAQRALSVLSHRRALEASPHWARLVEHARAAGSWCAIPRRRRHRQQDLRQIQVTS